MSPPIAEAGVLGFDAASWQMIVAPAKTPQWMVDRLSGDFDAVLSVPEVKEQIQNDGMLPVGAVSMPLRNFLNAEIARWGRGRATSRHRWLAVDIGGAPSFFCRTLKDERRERPSWGLA